MHRSPSWKSDENDVECRGVKVSGSVPGNPPLGASRYRTSDYRDTRDGRYQFRGVSPSSRGTITNSRYRRGSGYSTYDYTRRARHRNNDMDLYRMHEKEFDNVIHSRNVGGLLRQHSWSGSNMSLGSDRSRSSVSRDHRSSACSRQSDDADCGHIRSSNSHSVGTKLDEYDETKGTNLTYVAAGTAPVSTFRSGSCGGSSSSHTPDAPISTYTAPVLPQTTTPHSLATYPAAFNLPIEQCDLRHFEQAVPLQSSAVDDITSSASHLIFGQNGVDQRGTSAMRCNNVATSKMAKTISDIQAYAARQQLQNPSAYFCHHLEMERAALTLLNMMTAVQQPYVQQQRPASTVGRYIPELDCGDDAGAELAAGHQQQQANVAQLAGMLGALYPGVVGCGVGGGTAAGAGARSGVDDVSQQRARGGSDHAVSDDILPILMQLMQQMTPMNAAAAAAAAAAVPQAPIDDALLRQEKMRQHLQQAAAAQTTAGWSVQPAVMQQLMTQLSQMQLIQQQQQQNQQSAAAAAAAAAVAAAPVVVTKKTSSTAPPSMVHLSPTKSATTAVTGDSAQRPPSEYYSAVVARRSPTYGETSTASTKTNVSSSATVRSSVAPQKLERKVRCSTTATEAVPLSNAVATTTTSVRVDVKTPCGESGYQSESSPPLPTKSTLSGPVSKSPSTVVACGSKAAATAATKPIGSLPTSNSAPSFAAAAASGLSSSSSSSSCVPTVNGTAAVATNTTAAAVEATSVPSACLAPPTRGVQYEISEMDVLSEEIWHYHNSVTQSEKMLNRKLHLRDMLYYSICPVFPMCGLYVVGSSLNGFGNNTSDMDLCLMITNKDLDQKTDAVVVLNMILSTLQHTEWVSHQKLILAKVPILRIKFAAPFSDITVDLNANNSVAIKNTHLLCYYSSFDWRVRPLVSVVKEWAKRKGINDANRSSFTSYSLVLMVIHYLQCGTEPGVLPSLQQMYPRRFANKCDVRTLNVTLPLDTPTASEWQYADKSTLGELLIGFLDYYANKFDYDRDAISVRLGKRIDRAVIARQRPNGGYQQNGANWRSQWRCICIEEPFTYSNTAHSIYDEMVFDAIKTAFREAHQELDTTRDLQRLLNCKPIAVNAPMGGAMVYVSSYSSAREMSAGSTAGDSPITGPSRRSTPRGSSSGSSISTAHSAASSSGSSSSSDCGDDQDHDRMADVAGVPLRRQSKSRGRRIPRVNGSCLPPSSASIPTTIPVTTAAATAEQ